MFKNAQVCEPKIEDYITKCINRDILTAVQGNLNVVVDQTNCKAKYIDQICNLVKHFASVDFRVFDISLVKAIERDNNRTSKVGEEVIRVMFKNYKDLMDSFDFTIRKPKPMIIKERVNVDNKPVAIICDLDGTLAFNNGKRSMYDSNCLTDEISLVVKEQLVFHKLRERTIIILSGRDGNALESTQMWLDHYSVPYDHIYLRTVGDMRKDHLVKEEIYKTLIEPNYFVYLVYEDRESVVRLWRSFGIKCFQADYGDY